MDKVLRFNLIFIGSSIIVAIVACVATALAMVRVIRWYLSNCGSSAACSTADWLISYWWLIFIPTCLLAAWLLRRVYDGRLARLKCTD